MKIISKLALGMTVAMITMPALATGSMGNSQVWTTTDGSAVVSSNGNPVRTIHYINNNAVMAEFAPKASPSLLSVIQKAVAKILHVEAEKEPVIIVEENNDALLIAPTIDPVPVVVEVVTKLVVEEEAPVLVESSAVVTVVEPTKITYHFNNYNATILFDTDSAVLTADASGSLTQLAMATAKAESIVAVQVIGHADSRGKSGYNMTLSEERMLSVANFLDGLTLKATALSAKGETLPVLGTNGEDLTLSRRVQVLIKTRHVNHYISQN